MTTPFHHPSGEKLLNEIKKIFEHKSIFMRKDRKILFVCGGPIVPAIIEDQGWLRNLICNSISKSNSRSLRSRFLEFTDKYLSDYRVFLAELATRDLLQHDEPQFTNLGDYETLIAEVSDCIVLFPESVGSFAEIGFFSNNVNAIKKLLVVNDNTKQRDSFITIGILERVNRESIFREVMWTDINRPNFLDIIDRVNGRLSHKKGKKFELKPFNQLQPKEQFHVTYQIIFIFKSLTLKSVIYCLDKIFGEVDKQNVKLYLSLLVAVKYVSRIEKSSDYFIPTNDYPPFWDFRDVDVETLSAKIAEFYQKNHAESFEVLREIQK